MYVCVLKCRLHNCYLSRKCNHQVKFNFQLRLNSLLERHESVFPSIIYE